MIVRISLMLRGPGKCRKLFGSISETRDPYPLISRLIFNWSIMIMAVGTKIYLRSEGDRGTKRDPLTFAPGPLAHWPGWFKENHNKNKFHEQGGDE